jgi:F-type H+-transporting ATPase subunit alpha
MMNKKDAYGQIDQILDFDSKEISRIFEEEASNFVTESHVHEIGYILSISDGIAIVDGLLHAFMDEVIKFENNTEGIVKELTNSYVRVVLFGNFRTIKSGMRAFRTHKTISVGVGYDILGRVVDAFGNPIDGGPGINIEQDMPIETSAPQIPERKAIREPMNTGIISIDAIIPIGRGQRELIIGDQQTGKTSVAVSAILNQLKYVGTPREMKCVYVAIGQKTDSVMRVYNTLKKHGAMAYTTIVSATASYSAMQQFIAPYTGCAIAEFFMQRKHDCLIIYDDLSKHAIAYREISRLLGRGAGRDAYPADAFYVHARLLERAACLSEGGSITALPIIETQAGDVSAYISTNVISITDGQIFLDTTLFREAQRPAVDVGISVSRIGGDAQANITKKTAKGIRIELSRYQELKNYAEFAGNALGKEQRQMLDNGRKLTLALIQSENVLYSEAEQAIVMITYQILVNPEQDLKDIQHNIREFFNFMNTRYTTMMEYFAQERDITPDLIAQIRDIATMYVKSHTKDSVK